MAQIPTAIKQPLQNYLDDLTQHYHLNRVVLFGSMAQGTFHQDSDIDLALFSADFSEDNEIDIMADLMIRSMPYHLDIQPLIFPLSDYTADNDFIQQEIIARGIEIPIPTLAEKAERTSK